MWAGHRRFLGDELPSAQFPNAVLLERALKNIRAGDILMAHLGIWSRQDAWAPAVLDPLVTGLKQKGFCFATIDQHPDYREWVKKYARTEYARTAPGEADVERASSQKEQDESDPMDAAEMTTEERESDMTAEDTSQEAAEPQPDITLLDISTEKPKQHE